MDIMVLVDVVIRFAERFRPQSALEIGCIELIDLEIGPESYCSFHIKSHGRIFERW